MSSTSVVLVVSGIACLILCGFVMYKLVPREGQPPSAWTKTDFRATTLAMSQFVLLVAGIALVAKGIF
jgi:hypothetical protein